MSTPDAGPAASFRFAVNVTPKEGILDPQGRAVEQSLPHLGVTGVGHVRVGRRVEMTVEARRRGGRAGASSTVWPASSCPTRSSSSTRSRSSAAPRRRRPEPPAR